MHLFKRIVFTISLLLICACMHAGAVGDVAQVNLILDDGIVLIYKGADYGFRTSDYLDVVRGGELIGRLQILEVHPTFTKAKIVTQEKTIQVFDIVSFSAPGTVLEKEPPPVKKDDDKKKDDKKKDDKKSEPSAFSPVAMPDRYYNFSLGYFYLNQEISSINIEQPPELAFGVDYWMTMSNNTKLMVSYFMSNPQIRVPTSGSPVNVDTKFWSASVNYIFDKVGEQKGSTGSFYYGVGVAYRNFEIDDSTGYFAITGSKPTIELEDSGIDFHTIIGYRFTKDMEFKGLYSFDENYYSLGIEYGMR